MDYFVAPDRYETPEFILRSYVPGDGPRLNEATNSSYEHLRTYMAWAQNDLPVAESEKLVRQFCGHYLVADNFTMGIFTPDETRVLGGTGFELRDGKWPEGTAEVGQWIRVDAAGKGLGTKALLAMLDWGFDAWPWHRIIWRCDATNIASMRVAQKAGMRQEGHFLQDAFAEGDPTQRRDTLLFAMLRDEWHVRKTEQ